MDFLDKIKKERVRLLKHIEAIDRLIESYESPTYIDKKDYIKPSDIKEIVEDLDIISTRTIKERLPENSKLISANLITSQLQYMYKTGKIEIVDASSRPIIYRKVNPEP